MKKFNVFYLGVTLLFFITATAFANSGPITHSEFPSSDVISIDHNTPITVIKEDLLFDFSESKHIGITLNGQVTAAYEMSNPTEETHTVQMAFPLVGELNNISEKAPFITVDESEIIYDIYIGSSVKSYPDITAEEKRNFFDFNEIVNTISTNPYIADNFSEYETGKLYTIQVNPTSDDRINFIVDFTIDYENTKILTKGFNGYNRKDNKIRLSSWVYKPEVIELFVLGNDIEFEVTAFSDGELKKKTANYTYQTSSQESQLKPYLLDFITNISMVEHHPRISDNQLYNMYAKALDYSFTTNLGYCSDHDLYYLEHTNHIFTLVYSVDFPPHSTRQVSVHYNTSGSMDKRNTKHRRYTFDYILNPAKNWSDFKNLHIKILAPPGIPYVVNSNIELTKDDDLIYTAKLENLPMDDFTFTLYQEETVTIIDRVKANNNTTPLILFIILLTIGIIIKLVFTYSKHSTK